MLSEQRGFTLVELLAVVAITSLLMALGATSLRHYWFVRSLNGGRAQIVTELRHLQQRAMSDSHPLVFGARFRAGSPEWSLVRYDPGSATRCSEVGRRRLDAGVTVEAVDFNENATIATECEAALGVPSSDEFVFFYARGSATPSVSPLRLRHPSVDESLGVTVGAVTGRVDEV